MSSSCLINLTRDLSMSAYIYYITMLTWNLIVENDSLLCCMSSYIVMIHVDIYFQSILNHVYCMQGAEVCHNINMILINCISIILQTVQLKLQSAVKGLQTGVASVKVSLVYFLFVCLGFIIPLENFPSYGDVTITGEGL